jgi:hypothetical protein
MDKIRKKSKTMLALLLCALSVAALIPDAAPAYADNAEYAEESTETVCDKRGDGDQDI